MRNGGRRAVLKVVRFTVCWGAEDMQNGVECAKGNKGERTRETGEWEGYKVSTGNI